VKPDVRFLRQDSASRIGHAEGHHGVEFLKEFSKIKPNVNFSLLYPAPPWPPAIIKTKSLHQSYFHKPALVERFKDNIRVKLKSLMGPQIDPLERRYPVA